MAFLLHIRILEGKNLPGKDSSGYSDPWVEVKVAKSAQKTAVHKATLNPIFNEDFTFLIKPEDVKDKFVTFKVADKDLASSSDIGSYTIPLAILERVGQLHAWVYLSDSNNKPIPGAGLLVTLCIDKATSSALYTPEKSLSPAFLHIRKKTLYRVGKAAELAIDSERESKEGQMRDRFTTWVGTWNMGNEPPPAANSKELEQWIPAGGHDFFVVGAQECDYSPRKPYKNCTEDFTATISNHLGENYVVVSEHSMWSIRLVIFCLAKHRPYIHSILTSKEAAGIAHVMGNKGGVVTAFGFHDLNLAFVNTHLAAHQDQTVRRNADVAEVIDGLNLGKTQKMDIVNANYHHLFWMGDLNYRLDYGNQGDAKKPSAEQFQEMTDMIKARQFRELFETDQLTAERKKQKVFYSFQEGQYNFEPTFKVGKGEKGYVYDPKRSPAWTDRILWRSFPGFKLKQIQFQAAGDVTTSDHKPVSGIFALEMFHLPPATDPNFGNCTLTITNLECKDLLAADINGKSDPFVRFRGDFVKGGEVETSVKKKDLNPKWADKDVPPIPLTINSKKRLQSSYLSLRVFDYDFGTAPDLLGSGFLELGSVLAQGECDFNIFLTKNGVPKGSIRGHIKLSFDQVDYSTT